MNYLWVQTKIYKKLKCFNQKAFYVWMEIIEDNHHLKITLSISNPQKYVSTFVSYLLVKMQWGGICFFSIKNSLT